MHEVVSSADEASISLAIAFSNITIGEILTTALKTQIGDELYYKPVSARFTQGDPESLLSTSISQHFQECFSDTHLMKSALKLAQSKWIYSENLIPKN